MRNLIALLIPFFALNFNAVKAQENRHIVEPCKYIAQSGWLMPCLGVASEIVPLKDETIENIAVHIKIHKLVKENLVGVEGCRPESKEPKGEKLMPFAVREFFSYEVKGRVFAYQIRFTFIEFERDGLVQHAGGQYNAYYFDENGDGTFKIRCGAKGIENLPAWVKATGLSNNGINRTRLPVYFSSCSIMLAGYARRYAASL